MIKNTINDVKMITDYSKDVMLAGRYHGVCQLRQSGMGVITVCRRDMV